MPMPSSTTSIESRAPSMFDVAMATARRRRTLVSFGFGGPELGPGAVRHLAEQPVVEHGARDRRRGGAAVPAVFHQHDQRDGRVLGGRIGDEPGVIAVAL